MSNTIQQKANLIDEQKEQKEQSMLATILYIEDNMANQKLVDRVLSRHNYRLILADNGLAGMEIAMRENIDLVLMDINLPDMNGRDITAALKAKPKFAQTPIIALTADASTENRNRALAVGCDGFITKPIDIVAFPDQVKGYLNGDKEELPIERQQATLKTYVGELVGSLEAKVKELEAANVKLKKLDAAKSNFIHLVSHELRTPLTILNGYKMLLSSVINQDPENNKQLADINAGIEKGVSRLDTIIQEVVSVTKVTAASLNLKKGPNRVSDILEPVIFKFEESCINRQISIIVEDLDQLPIIHADGTQLALAFRNILGNAIKFTPDGGAIRIFSMTMRGSVTVAFKDPGLGVPPQEQQAIFDPFYTLEPIENHSSSKTQFLGGGLGLGLPIAKGIIEAHNGRVWVESDGRDSKALPGSTFFVLLPLQ